MSLPATSILREDNEVLGLVRLTMQACETARASVTHAIDGLVHGSASALQAVRKCEEMLDDFDRELDERLAPTITHVTPPQAQELLACMKLMLDLERIGDLVASFAERAAIVREKIDMDDMGHLTKMACLLENMLEQVARAFIEQNVDQALKVFRADSELDRLRNLLLMRHTDNADGFKAESLHVLFMATALERAGDHAKNIAEETCHLATGHTVRHLRRTKDKPFEQLFLEWLSKELPNQAKTM